MLCGFCWMNVPEIVSLLPYVLYLMSHFRIVCPTEKWWEISRFICKNYASWNIICWRKSMFFGVSFKMAAWVLVATEGSTLSTCSLATARQEGTFRSTPTAPLEFSQCEECGQGRGTLPGVRGQSECLPCPGGTFQNGNSDQGICKPCPLGTFRTANSSSSEGCLPCQAHTFADVPGLDACKACPSLASQPRPGQGWCLCDIGSYKDPSDTATQGATLSCLPCENTLPGSTTLHLNSKQQEDPKGLVGRLVGLVQRIEQTHFKGFLQTKNCLGSWWCFLPILSASGLRLSSRKLLASTKPKQSGCHL